MKRHYIRRMEVYFIILFALLPLWKADAVYAHLMVVAGTYAVCAMGLCLFMGHAGQISIGHSAFFGIGGYCFAILSSRFHVPSVAALAAGGIVAGLCAWIVARPLLTLRSYFLALATIGMVYIFQVFVTELSPLTGGVSGIGNLPWCSLFGLALDTPVKQFYLVWAVVYLLFIFARNIEHSKYGKAAASVALNETVARTIGVDPARIKRHYFTLSACYAGIGGALFAAVLTTVSPEAFGLKLSVMLVLMVIVGGTQSLGGCIFGAVALTWIMHRLGGYREYRLQLQGLLLIVLMVLFPEGLFRGIAVRWQALVRTWAPTTWRKEVEK